MPPSTPSEDSSQLDPILLRRLYDRLMQLRVTDVSVSADEVLEELHPSIRGTYESPLKEMLGDRVTTREASDESVPEFSMDATQQEEWTVDLPAGFKAEPVDLPPATRPRASDEQSMGVADVSDKLPEYVGKFRVKGELGRGANGVVYLGFDEELQRNVAIKLSLVSNAKLQERLRVEASKAAQVEADGIVPVYHIGRTDQGAVYIVQKYIEGSTLRSVLKNGGPLSPARGVRMIREIAAALEPAHLQDILHRDLKPDNILIDQSGKAWVADFGLAISEEEQQGRRCELAGTPAYMSPEQIKGRIDFLDPRSDLWGLGVIFYEVLTGKLPFSGKDRKALMEQICERDPRPMQQRAPQHLTPEMNDVFDKCCAKKPSDRFASTTEFIFALDQLIEAGLSEHNINGRFVSPQSAETLFQHATTTGRESMTMRRTESTVRTERMATGRATINTVEQPALPKRSNAPTVIVAIAAVAIVALIAFVVSRPSPPSPVVGGDPRPDDTGTGVAPRVGPAIEADGTSALPWIVANDGSGSHTTIQAAIEEPGSEHFIRIKTADNVESLDIRKKVTLIGDLADKGCTIRSGQEPAININCPQPSQLVTLKNLTIRGLGQNNTSPFNTIDVYESALAVIDCEIESRTQNGIKARGGSIELSGSTFQSISGSYAVSLADHQKASIKDCEFYSGGVELTRGEATFSGCRFQKGIGISTHLSRDRPIYVNDCHFSECYVGISVNNQVQVIVGSKCTFARCDWGAMLHSLDDLPVGELDIKSASFTACKYDAIYVAGGSVDIERDCEITNCSTGVFVESGTASLVGVNISGGSVAAALGIKKKDDLGDLIIRAGEASLNINGGEFRGAAFGLSLMHDKGTCRVNKARLVNNSEAGISYASGKLVVIDTEFTGGARGIFAFPLQPKGRASLVVQSSTFDRHSRCDVEATGAIDVFLDDCELSTKEASRLIQNPPSKIHLGPPSI